MRFTKMSSNHYHGRKVIIYALLTLGLCGTITRGTFSNECDHLGTLIYEDLGCTPVKKDGDVCPRKYDCGSFERKKDSCRFHARTIADKEKLTDDDTYASCNIGCFCDDQHHGDKADFTCAILDCPEWLGLPLMSSCYRKYELGKCCSIGEQCPPFDSIKNCQISSDTSIREFQKFVPPNTCLDCVCHRDFHDELDEKACMRRLCAAQLRHSADIENYCAPIYDTGEAGKPALCCPSTWLCPSTDDTIKPINPDAKIDPDLTCSFGKTKIKLGDGLERKFKDDYGRDRNVKCECILPPFLTCRDI